MRVSKKEEEHHKEGGIKVATRKEGNEWHPVGGDRKQIWWNQDSFQKGSETLAQRYVTNPEIIRYWGKDFKCLFKSLYMGLLQNKY